MHAAKGNEKNPHNKRAIRRQQKLRTECSLPSQIRDDRANVSIAIVGGGIAGFALGSHLLRLGFRQVHLFERDRHLDQRRQGYGLTLQNSGIGAIRAIGQSLLDRVASRDTPSRSHFIFNPKGKIVSFFGTVFSGCTSSNRHNLHISREELRKILFEDFSSFLTSASGIHWDKRLAAVEPAAEKLVLKFTDGSEHGADVVVGCDGVNSTCRRLCMLNEEAPIKYLGIVLVLGICKCSHYLVAERVFQTVDGERRLFAMPFSSVEIPDANVMWQLSFPIKEEEAKAMAESQTLLRKYLQSVHGSWHDPIPEMINSTEDSLLMVIPAYDRDPAVALLRYPNVVLIGDAAHPMSPFKGQGANQALVDVVEVAECLRKGGVLESFSQAMMKRASIKVLESRSRVKSFHCGSVLDADSYLSRGINKSLFEKFDQLKIDASFGSGLEARIVECLSLG